MDVTYKHVDTHLDDHSTFSALSLEQLNIMADSLAKETLTRAISTGHFFSPMYPFEPIPVFANGKTYLLYLYKPV
jgi:hypothetical protein